MIKVFIFFYIVILYLMNGFGTAITLVSNNNKLTNRKFPKPPKKKKMPPTNLNVIIQNKKITKRDIKLPGARIEKYPRAKHNYIHINKIKIPTSPFIWYRERHLSCPLERIIKLNKQKMSMVLKKYHMGTINADDYYVVIQRNIYKNSNLYISYHGYLYLKDQKKTKIPAKFNKIYTYKAKCHSVNNGMVFVRGEHNYKKNNKYITGNVHIHDKALSPPNHFKFKVKDDMEYIFILAHGNNVNMDNVNSQCLFILINDHNGKKNNAANILKYFEKF